MSGTLIGYARCSTDTQDLTAQRDRLRELGVAGDRIYLDHGLTGTSRKRPGLDQALAAVREGDTLVVPKLDRLARSVPDVRGIGDDLAARGIRLPLGGQVYDPANPMGKMFFNILATFAEFEVDLLRMRTREGMAVARAKGRLRGRQPKLSAKQQAELRRMHASGDYSIADLAELFTVSRPTVPDPPAQPRQPGTMTCLPSDDPGRPRPHIRWVFGAWTRYPWTAGPGLRLRGRWRCSITRWCGCAVSVCFCRGSPCWPSWLPRSGRRRTSGCTPR